MFTRNWLQNRVPITNMSNTNQKTKQNSLLLHMLYDLIFHMNYVGKFFCAQVTPKMGWGIGYHVAYLIAHSGSSGFKVIDATCRNSRSEATIWRGRGWSIQYARERCKF